MRYVDFDGHVHTLPICFLRWHYRWTGVPVSVHNLRKAVDVVLKNGISFALTDHDTLIPYRALQSNEYKGKKIVEDGMIKDMGRVLKVKDKGFIIAGQEVSSREGHVLAWGIDEVIKAGMSAGDTVDAIQSAGGMAIIPHVHSRLGIGEKNLIKIIGKIDGIELSVGLGKPAWQKRVMELAGQYSLKVFSNNDAHIASCIGMKGLTKIPFSVFRKSSGKAIISALRRLNPEDMEIVRNPKGRVVEMMMRLADIARYVTSEMPFTLSRKI
ncbi:MAG TPA: hypothetical protein VJC00_02155 [Candidatus Nanoarchaeia archaeon]|nr:hypothetical protein [Candidatus Nanoarchaeia archaeon]